MSLGHLVLACTLLIPQSTKTLTIQQQLDQANLDLAIAQYTILSERLQTQAAKQLFPYSQAVTDALVKARKSQGLDDTYEYDSEKHAFVQPKKTPEPAKK